MSPIQQMLLGVGAVDTKTYVDDIFSPTVWIGDGNSNRDIVNGIDISTEGGMVWIKRRNEDRDHSLFDTIRGAGKMLSINDNTSEDNETNTLTQFNTNGFRLNADNYVNSSSNTYCSFTFRKCPKFFSMATWSGNATSGRQIAHDLGVVPGAIIVKCYSSNGHAHAMYHRKAHASQPEKYFIPVDTGTGATLYQHAWNNTAPTSTHFTLGNNADFNGSGKDYVAWIFAHNNSDGDFGGQSGADGDVIKCDSYTGNGSSTNSVNVGFEPQFIMLHKQEGGYEQAPIYVYDCIRGIVSGGNDPYIQAAFNSAEVTNSNRLKVTATGFTLETSNAAVNENGTEYLYTCIRRPDGYVGKPPELGTGVFAMDTGASTSANTIPDLDSSFPVDLALIKNLTQSQDWHIGTRLQGTKKLNTNLSASESTSSNQVWDSNLGCWKNLGSEYQGWMWKRHAGFDMVAYEGNGTAGKQVSHSLSKTPEMIWIKNRGETANWIVYHKGLNGGTNPEKYYLRLNTDDAEIYLPDLGLSTTLLFNDTAPTSTVVTLGNSGNLNKNGFNHLMVLFASVDGISKLGSYTGTGSDLNVDCGFSAGARFVLIKRKDSTGNWYLYDSARVIVAGNDPYVFFNATDAEVTNTDYIDPLSSGFTVTSSAPVDLNASSGTYIFLAIA